MFFLLNMIEESLSLVQKIFYLKMETSLQPEKIQCFHRNSHLFQLTCKNLEFYSNSIYDHVSIHFNILRKSTYSM